MPTATTSYVNSTCPRVTFEVTKTGSTAGEENYKWILKYVVPSSTKISTSNVKDVLASIGGNVVYNKAITVGSKDSYTINSGVISLSKSHLTQTKSCDVSINWGSTAWNGTTLGVRRGSAEITLDIKTNYKISYNANGGVGEPSYQTKWYNETLTLANDVPTRSGATFLGWNVSSTAIETDYAAGDIYTKNMAATLYAVWKENHPAPKIFNAKCFRCESDGTPSDESSYGQISFDWSVYKAVTNSVKSLTVSITGNTALTKSFTPSGTSGTISTTIAGFSTTERTKITITITDMYNDGVTTTKSIYLEPPKYIVDFASGGNGIGIGGIAPSDHLHVYMPITYDIPVSSNGNCNSFTTSGRYYIGTSGTNKPINQNGWLTINSYNNGGYVYQEYISHAGKRYYRVKNGPNATWGKWIFIPMVQSGSVDITPSAAKTPTKAMVTFPVPFPSTPTVVVSPSVVNPGTVTLGASVAAVSATSVNIWLTRTNTTTTTLYWQAIEQE